MSEDDVVVHCDPTGHHQWIALEEQSAPGLDQAADSPVTVRVLLDLVLAAESLLDLDDADLIERFLVDQRPLENIDVEFRRLLPREVKPRDRLRFLLAALRDLLATELAAGPSVRPATIQDAEQYQ